MLDPEITLRPKDLFTPESRDDEFWDLLGPRFDSVLAAATSGDRQRLHRSERSWAREVVQALDIRIEAVGLDRIERNRRYVVAPLHEGFADVLALLRLPLELNWVIRDELLGLPYFGQYLARAGHIAVEPENPRGALRKVLRSAPATFAAGESLVVFPQGSVLGIETAFQNGAFRLAERFEIALLPIVLTGSHRVWEFPFAPTLRKGQHIRMEILDPIEPEAAVGGMREIEREMKRRALAITDAPARRYLPDRDGLWNGYRFDLDPDFRDAYSSPRSSLASS